MVVKRHILKTINKLNNLYNAAPNDEATYYSKLAILELCGWIEITMDNIVSHYANRKLRTQPYKNSFDRLKQDVHGFDYKRHFRKMMNQTVGMVNMEDIEMRVNATGQISVLEATLSTLNVYRGDAAHTFLNTTKTYQAPSVTKSQLMTIYPILRTIDGLVKALP